MQNDLPVHRNAVLALPLPVHNKVLCDLFPTSWFITAEEGYFEDEQRP